MNNNENLKRLLHGLYKLGYLVLFLVATMASVTAIAQPAARLGISPDRFEVVFDERGGDTQSLMIQNLSDEPITLNLSVSNWDLTEANQLRLIPPSETSLDQWIVINPVRVTVPPGTPQTVRWAIMPRLKPEAGEYRAMLFIEEDLPADQKTTGTHVRMKMRYGLPVYAQVGERIQSARLNGVNIDRDNNRIYVDVSNTGNSHGRLAGYFGIWPAAKFPGLEKALSQLRRAVAAEQVNNEFATGPIPSTVVLPDNRRVVSLDISLAEAGEYIVLLDAEIAGLRITETVRLIQPET